MEYITLKNSDLRVSRLCMGGCPMGGHGWGDVQEGELIAAVHAALDRGINFFDTADVYGLGQSEKTLAKALEGRRDQAVLATKFGVRVGAGGTTYDNSPEWIIEACDRSLQRLGTDYIDVYQIHYRDGKTELTAVVDALEYLRSQGKVRYFGLSNLKSSDIPEFERFTGRFVSVQNEYSLARRDFEADILALSNEMALTPMTWGSLGQGILTGKYGRDVSFGSNDRRSRAIYVNFFGEKLEKNLSIVDAMGPIAAEHGRPLSALAVRFILDRLPESVVLCGAKRPEQILSSAEAMDWRLSDEELAALERISR